MLRTFGSRAHWRVFASLMKRSTSPVLAQLMPLYRHSRRAVSMNGVSAMIGTRGRSRDTSAAVVPEWVKQQIAFTPDFEKYPAKQAPYKRNDTMLEVLPVGVLVFGGGGIQGNLADKARKLGIPTMQFEGGA